MRLDIRNRQFHKYFQGIKTFGRFYVQFHQYDMQSFIGFVLRFYLNFSPFFMILNKYRGVMDKCSLNGAASFLPGVLFVVELESYDKNDHFINI